MNITYWSDFACPFCFIGISSLMKALQDEGLADGVDFTFRAYELEPDAEGDGRTTVCEQMVGMGMATEEQMAESSREMAAAARAAGVDGMDPAHALAANTFDAHRLAKYAAEHGCPQLKDVLMRAYFCEHKDLQSHAVLSDIAAAAGLDRAGVAAMLASQDYADEVRADEQEAYVLGIEGVPHYIVEGRQFNGADPRVIASMVSLVRGDDVDEDRPMTGEVCRVVDGKRVCG